MSKALETDFENVDLKGYLHEVAERGVAYIPGYLHQDVLVDLQVLCNRLEFTEIYNKYEKVTERYYVPKGIPPQLDQRLSALAQQLQDRFSEEAARFPVLANWQPNDFSIQLYDDTSFITSHRDYASYKGVIAVISVQGEANFEVREARHSQSFAVWRTQPGDIVILRANGFSPTIEGHPGIFHAVSGALTPTQRISIGFRQK